MYLPSWIPSFWHESRQQQEAHGLDGSPSQLDRGRTPRSWSFARTAPPRLCRIDQHDSRCRSRDEVPLHKNRPTSYSIIQISREFRINCYVAAERSSRILDPDRRKKLKTATSSRLWASFPSRSLLRLQEKLIL